MILLSGIYYLNINIMPIENQWYSIGVSVNIPLASRKTVEQWNENSTKSTEQLLAQLSQDIWKWKTDDIWDKRASMAILVNEREVARVSKDKKGEQIITIWTPKNIEVDTSDITESLASKYPNQAKFIKLLITPWVKVSWDAYREIYDRLDLTLFNIDLNFWPRTVRARPWEVSRTENINFWDPNSTNPVVQDLRAIVREMNAKYFYEAISPFNPALYN